MKNTITNQIARPLLCLLVIAAALIAPVSNVQGWGLKGHEMAGRAAALKLPEQMPRFFRRAVDQLSYLNPEPDRWRDRVESDLDRAMDSAAAPDHYLDLELVPAPAFNALNRYEFTAELVKAGQKPTTAGFVPFRILELFQRIRVDFRLWRAETDANRRRWIEQRIINDAGILGHYVTDVSNPHHTTIHFNGWSGDNPKGYTVFTREPNQGIHYRFEDEYVKSHIQLNDFLPLISKESVVAKPREEIWKYLRSSNALVEQLYILDKQEKFNAQTKSTEHKKFVSERLAAGAQMLRDLWWTAWVTSAQTSTAQTQNQ
ncbi:MAG: hypothetical protein L0Y75_07670 [Acidobacteria bacterium]|nr:hypothetical protein [Acidobacteriota bacterium]